MTYSQYPVTSKPKKSKKLDAIISDLAEDVQPKLETVIDNRKVIRFINPGFDPYKPLIRRDQYGNSFTLHFSPNQEIQVPVSAIKDLIRQNVVRNSFMKAASIEPIRIYGQEKVVYLSKQVNTYSAILRVSTAAGWFCEAYIYYTFRPDFNNNKIIRMIHSFEEDCIEAHPHGKSSVLDAHDFNVVVKFSQCKPHNYREPVPVTKDNAVDRVLETLKLSLNASC